MKKKPFVGKITLAILVPLLTLTVGSCLTFAKLFTPLVEGDRDDRKSSEEYIAKKKEAPDPCRGFSICS